MAQKSPPPPSLQELNRRADILAARASLFFNGSSGSGTLPSRKRSLPPRDLEEKCCKISNETQQLQNECSKLPPLPEVEDEESPLGLLLNERRLAAELAVWKKQLPSVPSTDPLVIEADTLSQVPEWTKKLENTLKVVREEREQLVRCLEAEKQLFGETRLIHEALEKKDGAEVDSGGLEFEGTRCTVGERLKKAKEHCSALRESLREFVDKYLISSSDEVNGRDQRSRRGRHKEDTPTGSHPSLVEVIQTLISECLVTPEDPYISTETIWPPHLQLLLRSSVVERHVKTPTLIRITNFHHK